MYPFFFALRTGWLSQDRFMGKVLDEWATDTQEFVRSKLPTFSWFFLSLLFSIAYCAS